MSKQHTVTAIERYHKAALQGYAKAQCDLAFMLKHGHGCKQNTVAAFEWYRKASEQDDLRGHTELGYMLQYGSGCKKDKKQAADLYRKAALQGYAEAQYRLGNLLKENVNERIEAINWYFKAAAQKHRDAMSALNHPSDRGYFYLKESIHSFDWYQAIIEAQINDPVFQYNMGQFLERSPCDENKKEATLWFQKAAAQDDTNVRNEMRDLLEKIATMERKVDELHEIKFSIERAREASDRLMNEKDNESF